MSNLKILFFGDSPFSRLVLSELADAGIFPELFTSEVPPGPWDLFVVASYGKIISQEVLDIPKFGTLNVHPSRLPELRGAAPLQWTLLNGVTETAVTIMKMDAKMDHGPLVAVESFSVPERCTFTELHDTLAIMGGKLLAQIIPGYISGEIVPQEQDHAKATLARKLQTSDAEVSFATMTPLEIDRRVRALNPEPGTFAWFNTGKKKIRLLLKSGSPSHDNQDSKYIPEVVQPEGKKPMAWDAFQRGYPNGHIL